jgi:hypothetical protein
LFSSTPPSITNWASGKDASPPLETHPPSAAYAPTSTQWGSKAPGKQEVQRDATASCSPMCSTSARSPAAPVPELLKRKVAPKSRSTMAVPWSSVKDERFPSSRVVVMMSSTGLASIRSSRSSGGRVVRLEASTSR